MAMGGSSGPGGDLLARLVSQDRLDPFAKPNLAKGILEPIPFDGCFRPRAKRGANRKNGGPMSIDRRFSALALTEVQALFILPGGVNA